jgi:hypothetical protein
MVPLEDPLVVRYCDNIAWNSKIGLGRTRNCTASREFSLQTEYAGLFLQSASRNFFCKKLLIMATFSASNCPSSATPPLQCVTLNAQPLHTPGRLAWCMTVHKAQGASIDFLEVDLGGCFECGQAYVPSACSRDPRSCFNFTARYVALSRARCAGMLRVRNFDEGHVKTHEGAKRFHQVAQRFGAACAVHHTRAIAAKRPDQCHPSTTMQLTLSRP